MPIRRLISARIGGVVGATCRGRAMRRETIHAYLLLLPAFILLVAFTHWPAIATLIDSLYATPHGSRPAPFVGADNYRDLFDDPVFWQALRNNAWGPPLLPFQLPSFWHC